MGPRAPSQFDEATKFVRPEDVDGPVLVSADTGRHVKWLLELAELDVDAIYLHHVAQEQERFIETFAEHVLPEVVS